MQDVLDHALIEKHVYLAVLGVFNISLCSCETKQVVPVIDILSF